MNDYDHRDRKERLERAYLSLDGVAVGDAFGEMHFTRPTSARQGIESNGLPGGPWWHTDDTEMAMAVYEVLSWHGHIDQDALAERFTERFVADPGRGYGKMARMILQAVHEGEDWRKVSRDAFSGTGSLGNGAAMRATPLGAFFADDFQKVADEARLSAEVTHSHPEGIAGAVAVAVAAAAAWQARGSASIEGARRLMDVAYELTPDGETRKGIAKAGSLPFEAAPQTAAKLLGSGFLVTAPDTVPFALWCAGRHLNNYTEAMITTLLGEGDCDTNCAIVGGIVALFAGRESIPADWLVARERLELET